MKQSGPSDTGPDDIPAVAVSRDFRHASQNLVKRFLALASEYEATYPGRKVIVTCTYRSPEEQNRLYRQGRFGNTGQIVTNCDGITNKSDHNVYPARAIDCAVLNGGKLCYDEAMFYPFHALAKKHDLLWGGDWEKFKDMPHLFLPRGVK